MGKYNIWYTRSGEKMFDANVKLDGLEYTHVRVAEGHQADSLSEVYSDFQADMWPIARYEIWGNYACNKCGASHAVMSVGDVIEDVENGVFYAVDRIGFKQL